MKQAPAGSFAVWSSCLLQREGLPFVDTVVWGFWGNWFLYLPDLLGGDLLCTLVQAVEFTEKINAQRLGWVFSPCLVCFPCVIWPGGSQQMLHSEQPQTLLKTVSPAVSTSDEGMVKTIQWSHHISSWWHGSSPKIVPRGRARGSPIEWKPHILCIAGATERDGQQITSPGSISQ